MTDTPADAPSRLIDDRIKALGDWRGETLARCRALILEADPGVVEDWKWRGVPVWYCDGMICTGESYKTVVKLTFAKGAALADPTGLFNSSLDGNVRRAIDIPEGVVIEAAALTALVRETIALNRSKPKKKTSPHRPAWWERKPGAKTSRPGPVPGRGRLRASSADWPAGRGPAGC